MKSSYQKIFYIIGIIAIVFIFLKYILPILLKFLGFVISGIFQIIIWVIIIFLLVLVIAYIINRFKNG